MVLSGNRVYIYHKAVITCSDYGRCVHGGPLQNWLQGTKNDS